MAPAEVRSFHCSLPLEDGSGDLRHSLPLLQLEEQGLDIVFLTPLDVLSTCWHEVFPPVCGLFFCFFLYWVFDSIYLDRLLDGKR